MGLRIGRGFPDGLVGYLNLAYGIRIAARFPLSSSLCYAAAKPTGKTPENRGLSRGKLGMLAYVP